MRSSTEVGPSEAAVGVGELDWESVVMPLKSVVHRRFVCGVVAMAGSSGLLTVAVVRLPRLDLEIGCKNGGSTLAAGPWQRRVNSRHSGSGPDGGRDCRAQEP